MDSSPDSPSAKPPPAIARPDIHAVRQTFVRRLLQAEHDLTGLRTKVAAAEQLVEQLSGAVQGCDEILKLKDNPQTN